MDPTKTDSPAAYRLPVNRTLAGNRLAQRVTDHLVMRPLHSADFPLLLGIFSHPATTAHRPDPTPESEADCRQRLERYLTHWQSHDFGLWALEAEGSVIGFGGLTYRDGFAGLNLSYHLHPDHWRRGLASEFAVAAVDIAFADLQAPRVIGVVRHVNLASRRVLEKAGLTLTREIVYGGHPGLLYVKTRP